MCIEFKTEIMEATVLNPWNQFQPEVHRIEVRWDPLTGRKRMISSQLIEKYSMFYQPADEKLMREMAEQTKERCAFCPQNIDKLTPKFPPEIFPEERLHRGEAWVVPNLFQIYDFTAVAVLTSAHFLGLEEFSSDIFSNGISAVFDFYKIAFAAKPECRYPIFGMNYLAPAASTQFHPHLQVYLSRFPFEPIDHMIQQSKAYMEKNSVNYWQELIQTEKEIGERYVGKIGNTEWLTSFSPIGNHAIQAIICDKSNYFELDREDIEALSEGLSKILKFYKEKLTQSCFNFAVYSAPFGEQCEEFWVSLSIVSRPNFRPVYASDIGMNRIFYDEDWFFSTSPELLAASLRDYLSQS
jgi:galactose-1-phosphate uridylyltransferase